MKSRWDNAMAAATPQQLGELEALHAELGAAAGDRERFFTLNERFHLRLLELADNRWRGQMVADLRKVMKLSRARISPTGWKPQADALAAIIRSTVVRKFARNPLPSLARQALAAPVFDVFKAGTAGRWRA